MVQNAPELFGVSQAEMANRIYGNHNQHVGVLSDSTAQALQELNLRAQRAAGVTEPTSEYNAANFDHVLVYMQAANVPASHSNMTGLHLAALQMEKGWKDYDDRKAGDMNYSALENFGNEPAGLNNETYRPIIKMPPSKNDRIIIENGARGNPDYPPLMGAPERGGPLKGLTEEEGKAFADLRLAAIEAERQKPRKEETEPKTALTTKFKDKAGDDDTVVATNRDQGGLSDHTIKQLERILEKYGTAPAQPTALTS
jgi:hypothetical protein